MVKRITIRSERAVDTKVPVGAAMTEIVGAPGRGQPGSVLPGLAQSAIKLRRRTVYYARRGSDRATASRTGTAS